MGRASSSLTPRERSLVRRNWLLAGAIILVQGVVILVLAVL